MKPNLLLVALLLLSAANAYSQCQGPPQKIASPVCAKPTDAKVISSTCDQLQVQWKGSSNQTYEVTATFKDPLTKKTTSIIPISDITYNMDGSYSATIPVIAGTDVAWSVQSICVVDARTFYSYALRGGTVSIPACKEQVDLSTKIGNVFPNPTTGNISFEYLSNSTGNVQFTIYDITGKVVYDKVEKATDVISITYNFNLSVLNPGMYLLEARNGNEVSSKKFVIEK